MAASTSATTSTTNLQCQTNHLICSHFVLFLFLLVFADQCRSKCVLLDEPDLNGLNMAPLVVLGDGNVESFADVKNHHRSEGNQDPDHCHNRDPQDTLMLL